MNILICNDDGIYSEGIFALAKSLSREHNVLVVAPDGNRSAAAHSLSISSGFSVRKEFLDNAFNAYSISGTPVDCVKFAHLHFTDFHIDIVCSGINIGSNIGTDVLYSGTVSAGLEANSLGYPAFAFSSVAYRDNNFVTCGIIALKIVDKLKENLSSDFTYNVNVPNLAEEDIKGVKITKLGKNIYSDRYISIGENAFKLIGEPLDHDRNDEDCDVEWCKKGYVTVTPVLFDKTDHSTIKKLGKELLI